jgi:hypothetical protein
MSKIEELYKAKQKELGLDTIGPGSGFVGKSGGRYSGDSTPYSLGNGFAGKKDIDEEGLKAVELRNAKGNRYQVGEFGGGWKNAPGYTDKKKYSSVAATKK